MLDILEEIGLLGFKPMQTIMGPNVKLYKDHEDLLFNPKRYRRLVGNLNYLVIT